MCKDSRKKMYKGSCVISYFKLLENKYFLGQVLPNKIHNWNNYNLTFVGKSISLISYAQVESILVAKLHYVSARFTYTLFGF